MNEYNDQNHPERDEPETPAEREAPSAGAEESAAGPEPERWSSPPDAPPPPPPPEPDSHGSPRRDGYRGAPYSPRYDNQTYPPRGDQAPGPGGYPPPPPQQQYNPYQYNANSGWQQQPARPPEKYEWKFEDYDRFDKKPRTKRKANRGIVVFTVSLLCVLSVGIIGLAGYSIWSAADRPAALEDGAGESEAAGGADSQLEIAARPEASETAPAPGGKMTIPQVAEAVQPSVVGVVRYDNNQYFEMTGYGSGTIMTEDGYIITNAHVVVGGTGFKVQFADGDAYDAQLIGADSVTDLAVLKIPAQDLTPAKFGDSDSIKVGETVVAVGNPAGMEFAGSVTSGIISAVSREVKTVNYNMNFIQIDAAINPGNSGGPLANEYGQVIGINSSKIIADGYEGIGFAIPITAAKPIIDDIIANGRVTGRVMLGITFDPVDEVAARSYEIQMGLMIKTINSESDLNGEGVMPGDILTHIEGERIYDVTDVRAILDTYQVGDTVTLTFYRRIGTKEQTFDARTRLLESE